MFRNLKIVAVAAVPVLGLGVAARGAPLLTEPFTYADGELGTASGGLWAVSSGTGGQTAVGNTLSIDDAGTGDYNRALSSAVSTGSVYGGFTLTVPAADAPSAATGQYFAHFTGDQVSGAGTFFGSRVALATGTTSATYKIGVAGNGSTFTFLADELAPGTTYKVVHAYNLDTDVATLWVNPTSESSTNVTSASTVTDVPISRYQFRIAGSSDGDKVVDSLVAGTTFGDVVPVPEPTSLALLPLAGLLAARRRRRRA